MILHHVCIQTNCYEESLEFYRDVLGMSVIEETKDFHGRKYNTWLRLGEFMIELQTGKGETPLLPLNNKMEGIAHMCFCVKDLDETLSKIQKKGYTNFKLKNGSVMYEVFGGRLFKLIAPEGTIIEFRDDPMIEGE